MQALIYFHTHLCVCCMFDYTHTIHINVTVNFEDYFVNFLNFKQMLFQSKDFFFSHSVRREKDACQNQCFLLFPQCFHRGLFCMA